MPYLAAVPLLIIAAMTAASVRKRWSRRVRLARRFAV